MALRRRFILRALMASSSFIGINVKIAMAVRNGFESARDLGERHDYRTRKSADTWGGCRLI
jgi:hypothetical protein